MGIDRKLAILAILACAGMDLWLISHEAQDFNFEDLPRFCALYCSGQSLSSSFSYDCAGKTALVYCYCYGPTLEPKGKPIVANYTGDGTRCSGR